MTYSFAPLFAHLRDTHEFVVVRSWDGQHLEVFTNSERRLVLPDELLFA